MARSKLAQPHLSLDRFAEILGHATCAFNGVQNPDEAKLGCDRIWTQRERNTLAFALDKSEALMERRLGYPLGPEWFASEDHDYAYPVISNWGKILAVGSRSATEITAKSTSFGTDPVIITFDESDITGDLEIQETDTGMVVEPSEITISGGVVTVEIPRCRLVQWEDLENQVSGLDYNDNNLFLLDTTALTFYNVVAVHDPELTYRWLQMTGCTDSNICCNYDQDGCLVPRNWELGIFQHRPATYSNGTWQSACLAQSRYPDRILLWYKAGLTDMPPDLEEAVILKAICNRLDEICTCEAYQAWRKKAQSDAPHPTPFGDLYGDWLAWRWTVDNALGHGTLLRGYA